MLVVAAAAGCWTFGLLSSVLLRGRIRMSAICFAGRLALPEGETPQSVNLASIGASVLVDGHDRARATLGDATIKPGHPATALPADVYSGMALTRPATTAIACRVCLEHTYNPFLREVNFLLRGVHDGSSSATPVLPRHRVGPGASREFELLRDASGHRWRRGQGSADDRLPVPGFADMLSAGTTKTWSECLDHFNTRYTNIRTDLFLHFDDEGLAASGITREVTSTKEYATVEAEVYASEVLQALRGQSVASRVAFPRASIFDVEVVGEGNSGPAYATQLAIDERRRLERIHEAHTRTLSDRITTTITANSGSKLLFVLVQLVAGGALGLAANQL